MLLSFCDWFDIGDRLLLVHISDVSVIDSQAINSFSCGYRGTDLSFDRSRVESEVRGAEIEGGCDDSGDSYEKLVTIGVVVEAVASVGSFLVDRPSDDVFDDR